MDTIESETFVNVHERARDAQEGIIFCEQGTWNRGQRCVKLRHPLAGDDEDVIG